MDSNRILLIAGPVLLVLGLVGLFALYPMVMAIDGEEFEKQIVEASSDKYDFEDFDSGDTVRIVDSIARIEQNDRDQTVIWLDSSGKRDSDINFVFDGDITDDYGIDNKITITAEVVELRGSETLKGYDTGAEALDKDTIQPRYRSGWEMFFMLVTVAGLGVGIFGAVQFFRERAAEEDWEDDEEEWGMEMEAAGTHEPGKPHKPRKPRAPKVQLPYGKLREPWVTAVLTMATFGIYGLVWGYKVHVENKRHANVGPGGAMGLLFMFIPVWNVVRYFLFAGEVEQVQRANGIRPTVSAISGFWILVPMVGFPLYQFMMQQALNPAWDAKRARTPALPPAAPGAPATPGPRAAPPGGPAAAPLAAALAAPAQPLIMQCPNCQVNLQINDPTRPLNITCPGCQAGLVVR